MSCRSSNLPESLVVAMIIDGVSVKRASGCCDEGLIKQREECNGIVLFHFNVFCMYFDIQYKIPEQTFSTSLNGVLFVHDKHNDIQRRYYATV